MRNDDSAFHLGRGTERKASQRDASIRDIVVIFSHRRDKTLGILIPSCNVYYRTDGTAPARNWRALSRVPDATCRVPAQGESRSISRQKSTKKKRLEIGEKSRFVAS